MKIGIIKEGKTPSDARVPLTPKQCAYVNATFPVEIVVQNSDVRSYTNEEYTAAGVKITDTVTDCDVLLGVKEVPIDQLISDKTYFFFSHTIKEQPYNRKLLQAVLEKQIKLIDYEVLTNENGQRLIAFGFFAGMVGAHNGLLTYSHRTSDFEMKRMKDYKDYATAKRDYSFLSLPPMKIVLTGTGRVGSGARKVLEDMGIERVSAADFLTKGYNKPVFTQLKCTDYVARKDGKAFKIQNFYDHPTEFKSIFEPYTETADIMINGIYWDNNAPVFFAKEDMRRPDFKIKVIADITCDIAPTSSIPSTLFASTIADPFFGYDPIKEAAVEPFQSHVIDMMTIDNLPNELPRDASEAFGEQFIQSILPALLVDKDQIIERATIAEQGQLGKYFQYLTNYVS